MIEVPFFCCDKDPHQFALIAGFAFGAIQNKKPPTAQPANRCTHECEHFQRRGGTS